MNKNIIIGIVIVVIIGIGWFAFSERDDAKQGPQEPQKTQGSREAKESAQTSEEKSFDPAPAFTLNDWNGNEVSLSDFKGKPLIINSWAVWCPFCVDELPDFAKLQEELGDRIVIIAIDRSEPTELQREFTDRMGVTSKLIFLNDPKDSFYKSIGGFSMPETLFVDADGNIRIHKRGPMNFDEMMKKANSILAG